MSSRSTPLDGLRGLAIITVILNHIPFASINNSQPILNFFISNGKMGVCVLFILTGFLMSWLYPIPTPLFFWSRRYARLFPAFLVMVFSLSIIKNNNFSPIIEILFILTTAFIARLLWNILHKFNQNVLTLGFISTQLLVALWYSLYLLKIPSPIFYQTWPNNLQIFITALINGTLTLPFGNYIGQIDGVYWSLVTEVSFYLLYPILFIPVFQFINKQKSLKWKIILALSSLPFCWSLYFMSIRTPGFGVMIPYLYIYFIAGVAIGSNLSWFQQHFSKIKIFASPKILLLTLLLLFSRPLFVADIPKFYSPIAYLLPVIPMSLLLIILSTNNSRWGQYFDKKWLVTLGKYSYSLYLTHAICIEVIKSFVVPNTVFIVILFTILVFVLSFILSWCLYQIIEKPYYSLPRISSSKIKPTNSLRVIYLFSILSLIFLYVVYLPPVSMFTKVYPQRPTNSTILTPGHQYSTMFIGQENNLGMVTTHIYNQKSGQYPATLTISLSDSQNNLISKSNYNPSDIIENRYLSFGFPPQIDSKDKQYSITYQLVSDDQDSQVQLINSESSLNAVYFFNKNELIKNPSKLFSWFISKISQPFYNPMFWFCFVCLSPLLFLLNFPIIFPLVSNKHKSIRQP